MKNIFRYLLGLALLTALSAAQCATAPTSTIKDVSGQQCLTYDTQLSMTECDGLPHQNFTFGATGAIYVVGKGAVCLNGSFPPANGVSMGTCAQLTGYWWRPGTLSKKIHMAGGTRQCITRVGTEVQMQDCIFTNADQDWVIDSGVPPDWPFNGLLAVQNSATSTCIQAFGAQTGRYVPGTPLVVGNCEDQYKNEYFDFTPSGTILLAGECVTAGTKPGDTVTYQPCNQTDSQQWARAGNFLLSGKQTGYLCLGITGDSMAPGQTIQMQTCQPKDLFQQWNLDKLPTTWPQAGTVPTTAVKDAKLTVNQLESVVDWIQSETSITTTPFCYKPAGYDRSIGIAPTGCGEGQQLVNGSCYDNCREGYHRVNTPTCWWNQSTSYEPGTRCTKRDALGTCWGWAMKSCRDGYKSDGALTCWFTGAWSYDPAPSTPRCNSNRVLQAGLCYNKPQAGYTCDLTVCTPFCASGTADCGIGACANNGTSCGNTLADMVISPLEVLAFIGTAGAAGEAKVAVEASVAAVEVATDANALYQADVSLTNDVAAFLTASETHLADISTPAIEQQVAAGYVLNSPNYRMIAREWASRLLLPALQQTGQDINTIMISKLDPTGIFGTVQAFSHPTCAQHTAMPQY